MIDAVSGLNARDDWLWIVDHWTELESRLHKVEGGALTGMPGAVTPTRQVVIDLEVSDLIHEVTEVVLWYAKALILEGDWQPESLVMPKVLAGVAARYGHFTANDNEAVDFCDTAADKRAKIEAVLFKREAKQYVGPCPHEDCRGEMHAHHEDSLISCPECGRTWDRQMHERWKHAEMANLLMERPVMREALVTLGYHVPPETIRTWIDRDKLRPRQDGLFRLGDALELAQRRKSWQEVNAYQG